MANELSADQLVVLKEMFNLGIEKASGALAQMVDRPLKVNVREVKILPLAEVPAAAGGGETRVTGVFLRMLGSVSGSVLLCFPSDSARLLADLLLGRPPGTTEEMGELEESAIKETGNILTNTYLNVLAEMMKMRVFPSVPHLAEDMMGALMDFILIEIAQASDHAMVAETFFELEGNSIKGTFLVFPDENSLRLMLEKLGL
jgi:chemotaxis protein CheC